MFDQNESFRKALLASGDSVLTHSMGSNKESETVLTEREFCSRLMRLRRIATRPAEMPKRRTTC